MGHNGYGLINYVRVRVSFEDAGFRVYGPRFRAPSGRVQGTDSVAGLGVQGSTFFRGSGRHGTHPGPAVVCALIT